MASRIAPATPVNAPEASKPIFAAIKSGLGMLPNLYATVGLSPGSLQSVLGWDQALTDGKNLSKREIELLNLHISDLNGCGYCLGAHAAIGKGAGLSPEDIDKARVGIGANARENALLALARRVVRTGGARSGAELSQAREAGVSDAAVVDVLAAVALKTFTNSLAIVAQTEIDFPKVRNTPGE